MKPITSFEEFLSVWKRHSDSEFLAFEKINMPPFKAADLCGLARAYKFVDEARQHQDIVSHSGHDELTINLCAQEAVDNGITEADIIYLLRCGIRYEENNDSFCMFT